MLQGEVLLVAEELGGDLKEEELEKIAPEMADKLGADRSRTTEVQFRTTDETDNLLHSRLLVAFVVEGHQDLQQTHLPNVLKVPVIKTIGVTGDHLEG